MATEVMVGPDLYLVIVIVIIIFRLNMPTGKIVISCEMSIAFVSL